MPAQSNSSNGLARAHKANRIPSKRELSIWRMIRIDKMSRLETAALTGKPIKTVVRIVKWIDALRAAEAPDKLDVRVELEQLYRKAGRLLQLSLTKETLRTKRKDAVLGRRRKGKAANDANGQNGATSSDTSVNGNKADISEDAYDCGEIVRTKTKTAGNPNYLRLQLDILKELSPINGNGPSRVPERQANAAHSRNLEMIEALKAKGGVGFKATRTIETIESLPAPSETATAVANRSVSAKDGQAPSVYPCALVDPPRPDRAAVSPAPPQFLTFDHSGKDQAQQ
jgi:hypothetical protein